MFYLTKNINGAKIVKGESRDKWKTKVFNLTMPNRILYYVKIAKGESRDKYSPARFTPAPLSPLLGRGAGG
ncbi:hypothetical protein, partial [Bacteroides sp. CAG:633]|uniref:hypothetical protein n=1 Tax=Bacteroides sp. CAG:633 TaxID=1262744 RepID=UPI002589F09B